MDIRLKWILLVTALVVAGLVYRRWRVRIISGVKTAWGWFWDLMWDGKTCKVVEQFFLESSVLWFVFPLLDWMYDPGHHKSDPAVLTQAFVLAGVFFIFAVILSHAGKEGKD